MIPDVWEVKTIVDIISKRNGIKIGPFGSQLKKELLVNSGYKVYGQENVFDKNFEIGNRYLTEQHFEKLKSCNLIFGDFIISMMGTIGKCMIVPENIEKGIMDSHLLRLRLNEKIIKPDLLLHFFSSNFLINQVNKLSVGGIMDGLSSSIVKKIQFGLPNTLLEQTAIATALSDADGLITGLEKLIAKKRKIKQGAMQQLLKPKEGWEVKKLGDICEIRKGKGISKSQICVDGKYKCILYGELFTTYSDVIEIVISKTNFEGSIPSKEGDILFPGSTTTTGIDLAKASTVLENDVLLGGDIIIVRKQNYIYNSVFLTYFLNVIKRYEIAQNTKGITIHHLYGSDLASIKVEFPLIEEQIRISTILSDMDSELSALEQKLEKYKKIKLGMMQELLTGKTRLN